MTTALGLFAGPGGTVPGAGCFRISSAGAHLWLTATASVPSIGDVVADLDCPVTVDVRNAADESVFSASISMWITRRHG